MTNKNTLTFIVVVGFSMLVGFYAGRIFERKIFRQRMIQMRQNRRPNFPTDGGVPQRRNIDPSQRPNR